MDRNPLCPPSLFANTCIKKKTENEWMDVELSVSLLLSGNIVIEPFGCADRSGGASRCIGGSSGVMSLEWNCLQRQGDGCRIEVQILLQLLQHKQKHPQ
ncbi:hypothetical protein RRG08_005177 [Elysia crispata]|uniref:Uncharacterized protein n=1 Tax=Elysia crispata TaxID=231223 RepID=A0AAE1DGT1_9GAST|nr:hypothetical protein RRG08_005177 [Elysia crispata]